jgi:molybdopterin molybdotransferase
MIPFEEALATVLAEAHGRGGEEIPPGLVLGRTLSDAVRSPADHPGLDTSAMDGFAIDTGGETQPAGTEFAVLGRVSAGDAVPLTPGAAGAWEVATGAPVPAGRDSVVPIEQVEVDWSPNGFADRIRLGSSVDPGANIRWAAEDFRADDPVLQAGIRLGPVEILMLAALGVPSVAVAATPRVAVLCTGEELLSAPSEAQKAGRIHDANGPFLGSVLPLAGAEVTVVRTLPDQVEPFSDAVQAACENGVELVLSTGAVSVGRRDFVPEALDRLGSDLLFHGVAIRPGKPVLAARLPGGELLLGLPGNPVSAMVGFRFLGLPFLRAVMGRRDERSWRLPLAAPVRKRSGLRYFQRGRLVQVQGGSIEVEILPHQQASRIRPLLEAEVWVVLPEEVEELDAGALVEVYGLLGTPGDRIS